MTLNFSNYFNGSIEQMCHNISPDLLRQKLIDVAESMGHNAFAKRVGREMVLRAEPRQAIPDVYAQYRSLVDDGIAFFLSRISTNRLVDLVVDQLRMDPESDPVARLLALAKRFPTLHKMGQIIARNPNIDPTVKQWLVQLENGSYGTPEDQIKALIQDQLMSANIDEAVTISSEVLSEASVGAVMAFDWKRSEHTDAVRGVFKILKPQIQSQLDEELVVLEETAAFFQENRQRYSFKDFKFLDVFYSVRDMLVREIDLVAEQVHLNEAAIFFGDMKGICILNALSKVYFHP